MGWCARVMSATGASGGGLLGYLCMTETCPRGARPGERSSGGRSSSSTCFLDSRARRRKLV